MSSGKRGKPPGKKKGGKSAKAKGRVAKATPAPSPSPPAAAPPTPATTMPIAQSRGLVLSCAVLSFVLPLVLFSVTCSRFVGPVDSGALTVAAATGGVAHPPGFPLWLLLGGLFSQLPLGGSIAFKVNFLSSVATAGACLFVFATTHELLRRESKRAPLWGLVAGLAAATSLTVWEWATIAEVYGVSHLLVALVLWVAARWHLAVGAKSPVPYRFLTAPRAFVALAAIGGLGAANHTSTFAVLGVAVGVSMLPWIRRAQLQHVLHLVLALLAAGAGLSLYLTLLGAARNPDAGLTWGGTSDMESLLRHVRGWQYAEYFTKGSSENTAATFREELVPLTLRQWGWWWNLLVIPGAALGLVGVGRRSLSYLLFLAITVGAGLLLGCAMQQSDDKSALFAPSFLVLAVVVALGLRDGARRLGKGGRRLLLAVALLWPLTAGITNYPLCDRSEHDTFERYARAVAAEVPQGGALLTAQWQLLYPPLLYLQECEGFRPDLEVWGVRLMNRSWYLERIRRRNPELATLTQGEWEAFLPLLTEFEGGRDVQADPDFGAEINDKADAFMRKLFSGLIRRHEVHLTTDIVYTTRYAPDFYQGFLGRQFGPALRPSGGSLHESLLPQALTLRAFPEPLPRRQLVGVEQVAELDPGTLFTAPPPDVYHLRLRDQDYFEALRRRLELEAAENPRASAELLEAILTIGENAGLREAESRIRRRLGDAEGSREALERAAILYRQSADDWRRLGGRQGRTQAERYIDRAKEIEFDLR